MRWLLVAPVVLAVGVSACGGSTGGSGGGSVSSAPLAGMINGQPWTFAQGQTDFVLSSQSQNYFANLYDVPITMPCTPSDPPGSKGQLILNIPKTAGTYQISLALTQTFVFPDPTTGRPDNDIATSGTLEVTAISSTQIMGAVKMEYDAKNSVDGQLTINNGQH